jgi:hypothetical protein
MTQNPRTVAHTRQEYVKNFPRIAPLAGVLVKSSATIVGWAEVQNPEGRNMRLRAKLAILLAASVIAVVAPAVPAQASVPVAPASATVVPHAYGAIDCAGDVCIQSTCAHCNIENINAWANRTTFTGHFEFFFGIYVIRNSPDRTWPAGGTHYTFTGVSGALGSACVTAWKKVSGGYSDIGTVCFYL